MNYDPATKLWSVDVTLVAGEMKFRWDSAWTVNLGGSLGALTQDGANMKVTAGTYTIVLNPDAKTATMTKNNPVFLYLEEKCQEDTSDVNLHKVGILYIQ